MSKAHSVTVELDLQQCSTTDRKENMASLQLDFFLKPTSVVKVLTLMPAVMAYSTIFLPSLDDDRWLKQKLLYCYRIISKTSLCATPYLDFDSLPVGI